MADMCIDAGALLFDSADSYSNGLAEEILGRALEGRREKVLISTKVTTPTGDSPNEGGSSRLNVVRSVEESLRRLRTDYVDLLYLHEWDGTTPVEEAVRVLDDLVTAGKVRYVGASNFSGWQLMKALAIADRYGWVRHAAHQVSYSLAVRDYEWELAPLAADQGVGAVVYSPLGESALTGKVRRGQPLPADSRVSQTFHGLVADEEHIYAIVELLDELANETGRSLTQIAINWLLHRPTVSTVVMGARTPEQLRDNLLAADWSLSREQIARLDDVSDRRPPYPYSHQRLYPRFDPRAWSDPKIDA
jgi:aryl-alcohol dehydrogenase-like predicted oxidoreductase